MQAGIEILLADDSVDETTCAGLPLGISSACFTCRAMDWVAAGRGACAIEKHFTLHRSLPGPDHRASLEADEIKDMVGAIRTVEQALGDGVKAPRPSEMKNRDVVRKSLVSLTPIRAGERFTEENLGAKRPGAGVSPMEYWEWLGRRADRDTPAGAPVRR